MRATSWSLHTYSVGTETFWLIARGLDSGIARYQLSAAVRAPGSRMPCASRSATARVCPACRSALDNMAPLRRNIDHSGRRGNWKRYMYQDARPCRLFRNDLRNAAGCGTDIGDTVASRSGISAAAAHATAAPPSCPTRG